MANQIFGFGIDASALRASILFMIMDLIDSYLVYLVKYLVEVSEVDKVTIPLSMQSCRPSLLDSRRMSWNHGHGNQTNQNCILYNLHLPIVYDSNS